MSTSPAGHLTGGVRPARANWSAACSRIPEVVATARRTGAPRRPHAMDVRFRNRNHAWRWGNAARKNSSPRCVPSWPACPGTQMCRPADLAPDRPHAVGHSRQIAVKIFGPDLYELRAISEQIKGDGRTVEGRSRRHCRAAGRHSVPGCSSSATPSPATACRSAKVSEAVETAFAGLEVSRVIGRSGELRPGGALRPDERGQPRGHPRHADHHGERRASAALGAGRRPQGSGAVLHHARERAAQDRGHGQRRRRDLDSVVDDIRREVASEVKLPAGYHIEYGGQFESAEEASRVLLLLGWR